MTNWQKHWSNSSNDPRMQMLIGEMGAFGYGLYWLISEYLSDESNRCTAQNIVQHIRSRKINRRHIVRVLDEFWLFETDSDGIVQQHQIPIGNMSAHLLHQLKNGDLTLQPKGNLKADMPLDNTLFNTQAGEMYNRNIVSQRNNINEPARAGGSFDSKSNDVLVQRLFARNEPCVKDVAATLAEHPKMKKAVGSLANMPWCAYVLSLFAPQYDMWRQTACCTSGYATLLDRNWETAVAEFVKHIIAMDRADEIRSDQKAHYYFANYVNRYHASGKALLRLLKQQESAGSKQHTGASSNRPLLDSGFEQLINGVRYANGKPIPPEAPPRPSPTALWDAGSHQWSEFYS